MREKTNLKLRENNSKGITLMALVLTIVVLLILAGITIALLFSNNGLITKAQEASNSQNDAYDSDMNGINSIVDQMNSKFGKINSISDLVEKDILDKSVITNDIYGNAIVVPAGFSVVANGTKSDKIANVTYKYDKNNNGESTGIPTVPDGIVIKDSSDNQFIWVPIGTIKMNKEGTITKEVKLGRYDFDTTDGTPTLIQAPFNADGSDNYVNTNRYYPIGQIKRTTPATSTSGPGTYFFTEFSYSTLGHETNTNLSAMVATAKDLKGFLESARDNKGFYIARYEATYGGGYNSSASTSDGLYENAKAGSIISTKYTGYDYTEPRLLYPFSQKRAAILSRNMYKELKDDNGYYIDLESDLINSYAWDTTIVFIQNMGNENYANAGYKIFGSSSLTNTGTTNDVACNICDMAANAGEMTTEYSSYETSSGSYNVGVKRGGTYNSGSAAGRSSFSNHSSYSGSFRVIAYIRN